MTAAALFLRRKRERITEEEFVRRFRPFFDKHETIADLLIWFSFSFLLFLKSTERFWARAVFWGLQKIKSELLRDFQLKKYIWIEYWLSGQPGFSYERLSALHSAMDLAESACRNTGIADWRVDLSDLLSLYKPPSDHR